VRLLIAIPVYNERKYVETVLDKVRRFHNDILVIDDGSTDGTGEHLATLAERSQIHLIRHPVNRGYGQSLIDAFEYADARGYDWVITMDCDEQHEPERIPDFKRAIESDQWDIISGSRYMQQMARFNRPDDYYEQLAAKYRALQTGGVDQALRGAINPDAFTYVVVGDAAKVKPQLDKLGIPVEVMPAQ